MRTLRKALLAIAFMLAFAGSVPGCGTTGTTDPGGVVTPKPGPFPIVNGIIDCALPALWSVVSFASLVPIFEHAVAQMNPLAAINELLLDYSEAEVACVAAALHDAALKQAIASPSNSVVKKRTTVTAQWLEHERERGVTPTNFAALVN